MAADFLYRRIAQSGAFERVTRQFVARAGAFIDQMVDSVAFGFDQRGNRLREIVGVGRVRDFVKIGRACVGKEWSTGWCTNGGRSERMDTDGEENVDKA